MALQYGSYTILFTSGYHQVAFVDHMERCQYATSIMAFLSSWYTYLPVAVCYVQYRVLKTNHNDAHSAQAAATSKSIGRSSILIVAAIAVNGITFAITVVRMTPEIAKLPVCDLLASANGPGSGWALIRPAVTLVVDMVAVGALVKTRKMAKNRMNEFANSRGAMTISQRTSIQRSANVCEVFFLLIDQSTTRSQVADIRQNMRDWVCKRP